MNKVFVTKLFLFIFGILLIGFDRKSIDLFWNKYIWMEKVLCDFFYSMLFELTKQTQKKLQNIPFLKVAISDSRSICCDQQFCTVLCDWMSKTSPSELFEETSQENRCLSPQTQILNTFLLYILKCTDRSWISFKQISYMNDDWQRVYVKR